LSLKSHPTVTLLSPEGYEVKIDEKIADLIFNLWKLGYKTTNSCQDNYIYDNTYGKKVHFVWIEFASPAHATKFVKKYVKESVSKLGDVESDWLININVYNSNSDYIEENDEVVDLHPFNLQFPTSVRFPIKRLPSVMKAFSK
jgi:hypothetical protein